jgi:hypothetical protein
MTILVGYPINRRAKAVLSLAGMLARSSGEDLLTDDRSPKDWSLDMSGRRTFRASWRGRRVANLRLPGPSALTLAPPLSTTNICDCATTAAHRRL